MLGEQAEVHADLFCKEDELRLLEHHLLIGEALMGVLENELQTDFHESRSS
jgi:hypothetical protein